MNNEVKRSYFKRKQYRPMKRTRIKVRGSSKTADLKSQIQDLLRAIVIIRDGGCILRNLQGVPQCNGYRSDGELILQADHLITRSNSATYAELKLVVCVCKGHHGWKKYYETRYNEVVRKILPTESVELWDLREKERFIPTRKGAYDWKMEVVFLKEQLRKLSPYHDLLCNNPLL